MFNIENALSMALDGHWRQVDKAGDPYILHCLRVMSRLPEDDETGRIVALLHDLLEDTTFSESRMRERGVPEYLLDAVKVLTRGRDEKYRDYIERCGEHQLTRRVKIADLQDHLAQAERGRLDLQQIRKYRAALFYLEELNDDRPN